MTPEQDIRAEIIFQLYAVRPLAVSAGVMSRQARKQGLMYGDHEMFREALFLCGQKLIEIVEDRMTGEDKFSITSAGVLHYERQR